MGSLSPYKHIRGCFMFKLNMCYVTDTFCSAEVFSREHNLDVRVLYDRVDSRLSTSLPLDARFDAMLVSAMRQLEKLHQHNKLVQNSTAVYILGRVITARTG